MQISSVNFLNSIKTNRVKNNDSNIKSEPAVLNNTELPNYKYASNVLVNFGSKTFNSDSSFSYTKMHVLHPEEFEYDKETGCFEYIQRYLNGQIKKMVQINQTTGVEFIRNQDLSGSIEEITKFMNGSERFDYYNSENSLTFSRFVDKDGSRFEKEFDYNNNRIIQYNYNAEGEKTKVRVFDLATGLAIPRHDERMYAIKTIRDGIGSKKEIEYDLRTDEEYSSKTYKNNQLIHGYKRDKISGETIWRAYRGGDGSFIEKSFSDKGVLEQKQITNPKGTVTTFETYDDTGKEVVERIEHHYDFLGNVSKIVKLNVETDMPTYVLYISKDSKSKDFFNKEGVRTHNVKRNIDGEAISKLIYGKDGKTKKELHEFINGADKNYPMCHKKITYFDIDSYERGVNKVSYLNKQGQEFYQYTINSDGEIITERNTDVLSGKSTEHEYDFINFDYQLVAVRKFDANGNILSEKSFWDNTNIVKKLVKFKDNGSTITLNYNHSGVLTNKQYRRADNSLRRLIKYYADGVTPKFERICAKNGNYQELKFNPKGEVISDLCFDKDGNEIFEDFNGFSEANFDEVPEEQVQSDLSIDDVIATVSQTVTSGRGFSKFDLDKIYWEKLAQFCGLNNADELLDMDKKTYIKLAKTFHTDQQNDINSEQKEELIRIINTIHEKNS